MNINIYIDYAVQQLEISIKMYITTFFLSNLSLVRSNLIFKDIKQSQLSKMKKVLSN